MKFSHLLSAALGATAVFVIAKIPKSRADTKTDISEIQKKYESHSNPRAPLTDEVLEHSKEQSGSGLQDGNPKTAQTSDWYGNQSTA